MITYAEKEGVLIMDLVDLEHCGFDADEFLTELQIAGITGTGSAWPVALLVNYTGGAIVTPDTPDQARAQMVRANRQFQELRGRLLGMETIGDGTARSSPTCDRCAADEKVEARYFVEYQALMVNDPEYMAETGEAVYGWWGHCCVQCLREVVHLPELVWLEAVDLCDVIHVELGGGWQDHQPDWSKAVVRVGSRTPSKAMQRLFQACDPQDPKVCPQEALERLAVLRMLEDV